MLGVTIAGPSDAWATGFRGNLDKADGFGPVLLHFTGTAVTSVSLPQPGGPQPANNFGTLLRGVTSLGPDDVYAVGNAGFTDGTELALIEHYNGTSWSVLPSPQPGDDGGGVPLDGLASVSAPGNGETSQAGQGTVFFGGSQGTPQQLFGNAPLALLTTSG